MQCDIYVDDFISGAENHKKALSLTQNLESIINKGGFQLKVVSFSGEGPSDTLSDNSISINVGVYIWFPKADQTLLNTRDLNFSRKRRGKKPNKVQDQGIPEKLTRRHCVAKVGEIFDLTGKVMPLVASMKLDLH